MQQKLINNKNNEPNEATPKQKFQQLCISPFENTSCTFAQAIRKPH